MLRKAVVSINECERNMATLKNVQDVVRDRLFVITGKNTIHGYVVVGFVDGVMSAKIRRGEM